MPRHTTLKATYRLFVGFTKLFVIPWSSFGGDFDLCSFDNSNDLTSLTKKEGLNAFSREVRSMCLEIYKQHNTSYSLVWFVPACVLLLQKASKGCENFQNKHAWPTTHIMIDSHGKRKQSAHVSNDETTKWTIHTMLQKYIQTTYCSCNFAFLLLDQMSFFTNPTMSRPHARIAHLAPKVWFLRHSMEHNEFKVPYIDESRQRLVWFVTPWCLVT